MKAKLFVSLSGVCVLLVGCGGGGGSGEAPPPQAGPAISSFTADQASYFVGSTARLTAVFARGSAHLEPGTVAIASGQPVTTPVLSADITYRLVVSDGSKTVTRDLALDVNYRDRLRTLAMPAPRAEHTAVSLPNGRVVIVGGEDARGATLPTSIYQFDPTTETFSKLGDLATGRVAHVAAALTNGDVLVAFGGKSLSQAPDAEIINGQTGVVSPTVGNPIRSRYYATATVLADARVLIAGGSGMGGAERTAEVYEPSTGTFTLLPAVLGTGRYGHTATRLDDGQVLIYGGFTSDSRAAPPEIFDPTTSTFTTLPAPENGARGNHLALKAPDGRVWIIGGEDELSTPLTSVLRFDPETRFALGPNLATPRTMLGGAALTDGRLVLMGGQTGDSSADIEASSELVTGLQNRNAGPPMDTPRFLHTVTRLPSGRVLIVGGLNRERLPVASAQILE